MSDEEPRIAPFIGKQAELMDKDLVRFGEALDEDGAARGYLKSRGFEELTLTDYRLGVVPDDHPGYEQYAGMIVIPYLNLHKKPVSLRFRNLEEHGPKYLSMTGSPSMIYNVPALHDARDSIHICEGEFDCITLNMCGLPAVGFPGANAWKGRHAIAFRGFSSVYVWGDPDQAGREFTTRLLRAMPQAVPVRLQGGDVNETFLREGSKGIQELLREAKE